MLYVPMEVNGVPLKAFVDSGAQMTIMGRSCAERCGLLRLMDTHFSGVAKGVGSSKILGRIHMAPLKAGNQFFPSSITVLEQDGMEFLFGLDNLKRHQCCIDLATNALRFGSTAISLPFLPEHEIPKRLLTDEFETLPPGAEAQPPAPAGEAPPPAALQQQQQQQQQPGAAGQAAALPAGWEDKVARLQALGFSRGQCDAALRSTGGDEELAGSMLFSME
jgi:DNA damage-inducible protein 1